MKSIALLCIFLGVCYGASLPRASRRNCPQFCPQIFSPVCGSDGKEFRTFSNDCEMDAFNCWQSRDFQLLRSGLCEEREDSAFDMLKGTIEEFAPIEEIVEQDSVRVAKKDCKPCTRIYLPVCGSDGGEERVFGNECEMNFVNCMDSREFALLRNGEC